MSEVGERIKEQFAMSDITIVDFAKRINMSPTGVRGWVVDGKSPRADLIPEIAKILGVSESYLMHGTLAEEEVSSLLPLEQKMVEVAQKIMKLEGEHQRRLVEQIDAIVDLFTDVAEA